jgi:hypothetical protein
VIDIRRGRVVVEAVALEDHPVAGIEHDDRLPVDRDLDALRVTRERRAEDVVPSADRQPPRHR